MNLAEISACSGLPTRRIRYVLDHGVLPGGRSPLAGRGVPRYLTDWEAFCIACAALLLEAGMKRKLVQACFDYAIGSFLGESARVNSPLFKAFQSRGQAWLEVGDGTFLRLHGKSGPPLPQEFDSGWRPLAKVRPLSGEFTPLVLLRVDLAGLRHRLGL